MGDHGSLVGQQLSDTYRIVRELAAGGMGSIYEAVHLRLGGKRYAIKVLASRYAANPDALARFRREALVTSGLCNEHIVEVHDFNIDGGLAYLVMELLAGEDLAARVKRARSLSTDAIVRILAQVVVALDAAHRARIVHRDLKPQNIFLCTREGRDDYVKILDFGISKLLDASTVLTGEHALLGTPYYMAPEQAQGNSQDLDGRADVFALGAILWELLTGRLAFGAPTLSGALYKVVAVDPPDVHTVRPDLPPAVSMVLRRALAKDRTGRTPDVLTLGREFAAALQGVAPDSVPPPVPRSVTTLAEAVGAAPDTVGSSPAHAARVALPTSLEGGAGVLPLGTPNHPAGPPPTTANQVSAVPVASAALPAWMPSWPTADRPAPAASDPGVAPTGIDSVHIPARRSRRRAIIALAAICVTAVGAVTGAVLGVRARSSDNAGVGEGTAVAPPPPPEPAPGSQRPDEVAVVFEIEPPGAPVTLRVDGIPITERHVRRTRSRTPLVVTAEAAGYLPFQSEPVPDQDQIVMVRLRPSPAVTAKGVPPRRAPPPSAPRAETHPPPARASSPAGAGSASPRPTVPASSRPRYVPSPSVTRQVPVDAGVPSSPGREASAGPDAGAPAAPPARPPQNTGTIFDNH